MREFKILAILRGYVWVTNPHESYEWRGSHVEDIKERCSGKVIFSVWASSRERALEIVNDYYEFDFSGDWYLDDVEEVKIVGIEEVPDTEGLSDEEFVEVEYE